ncbi:GumC family protein [Aestuariivirga sp.]|uniref:GumC family protein n=1 Tax=Aestuariivirga sp. TaxID=2650926 RepID=UPI0039E6B0C1
MSLNQEPAGAINPAINIMDVLRGVARRKMMISVLALSAFAGGFALVNYLKPSYSTESQVLIGTLETPFDKVQPNDNQAAPGVDDRVIESQMAVLKSDDLGRRVVAALDLQKDPAFNPLLKGLSFFRKLRINTGFADDPRLKSPEELALDIYDDGLSVYQQPNSNVISIKYTAGSGATAAKVANTLAEVYVMATRESQAQPTERAREWLAQQIDALRKKLADSEQAVEEFRSKAGLIQGATTTLGAQEISELNTQITVAQTASAEAQAKAQSIRDLMASKGSVDGSADVMASPVIQRLKEQRVDATRAISELSATYLPNHPKMIAARSHLSDIDKQIRAEALRVVSGLDDQARVAQAREKSLRDSLEQLKGKETTASFDDVKLKALERDAAANRALLETMLSRYAEASTRQDEQAQPGFARIIQTASAPTSPSFPKRGPLVVLITIAGLAFGLGLAFLLELMAAAARLTERMAAQPVAQTPVSAPALPPAVFSTPVPQQQPEIRIAPEHAAPAPLPPLGVFPAAGSTPEETLLSGAEIEGSAAEIADWIGALAGNQRFQRITVATIGAGTGDGSAAAVVLARTLSLRGRRVVLADLSRGGSWIEPLCGLAPGQGIADLITGAAPFTKVLARDPKSGMHVLRFGVDRSPAATDLLDSRLPNVLSALGQSYDAVVVYAGEWGAVIAPLLGVTDAAIILTSPARFADFGNDGSVSKLQGPCRSPGSHWRTGHAP